MPSHKDTADRSQDTFSSAYSKAEKRFGQLRAEQLRMEIEQLASDVDQLREALLDTGNEP